MTPEERDQLIQRYYDGESIGAEAAQAEQLLQTDPEAKAMIESLRDISDSIQVDLAQALAREDFSTYWDDIAGRLPTGVPTADPDEVVVARTPEAIGEPRRPWYRWFMSPAFGAVAVAALVAVAVLPNMTEPELAPVSFAVEIEEVETSGAMVVIQEASATSPAIVSFQESWDG